MRKFVVAAIIAIGLIAPVKAHAQVLEMATGATLGGLAGAVYVSGFQATTAAVSGAALTAADAVVVAVPAVVGGVAGAVAATSTPVLVGIVIGGVFGLMLSL